MMPCGAGIVSRVKAQSAGVSSTSSTAVATTGTGFSFIL